MSNETNPQSINSNGRNPQSKASQLYDRNAQQRVLAKTEFGGELFEIGYHLTLPSDGAIVSAFAATDDEDKTPFEDLFKGHILSADGCADDEGNAFKATELAELVPAKVQRFVIENALLGAALKPKPKGKGQLNWRNPPTVIKHELKAYYNGDTLVTQHWLNRVETLEIHRAWRAMEKGRYPVKFGDIEIRSMAQGLVVLYEALVDRTAGYVGDIVPAHHKLLVARFHLEGEHELLLGK